MRYPALTLLMAVHYLAAVLGGLGAYLLVRQQYGSFWAVAGAVVATLVMAAIGDAIRLATDIEASIRELRPKAQWAPPAEWSRSPPPESGGEAPPPLQPHRSGRGSVPAERGAPEQLDAAPVP